MIDRAANWFASRGWTPFEFQHATWRAYGDGASGLVHAPTGLGKSLAVWMGPLLESLPGADRDRALDAERVTRTPGGRKRASTRDAALPLRVLWITPLRALAADTTASLLEPVKDLSLPWTVESRTGDTSQAMKRRQRERLPTALVTTPESLSLLLSYDDARERLASLRCVVVDEWHELMGTKRGVQTELALARLREWNPGLRTWGLSATLGNLRQAMQVLMGSSAPCRARLIEGNLDKRVEVQTLIPDDMERFPWAGHIGLRLLPRVIETIGQARSTLLFTNTRSQTEIWFRAIVRARPDWLGTIAIHHGSVDQDVRGRVEAMLKTGAARCVVCTSSLDLGVDFSPVDQVIQVGSPKGVARLMQRAGRSGHQPGAVSRIVCVPTHAFELMEFAAAREALTSRRVESREPIEKPLDVLAQHLVTIAMGGGFDADELRREVRTTHAFRDLSDEEWDWAMQFVRHGGSTLTAYPQFARIVDARTRPPPPRGGESATLAEPGEAPTVAPEALDEAGGATGETSAPPRWIVASRPIASMHRMNIGTISADSMMRVQFVSGRSLGSIEESFIARLAEGDVFVFAGRVVELARVRDMTAFVRRSSRSRGIVPAWNGGRMPLSAQLSDAVRDRLEEARTGAYTSLEMRAVRPLLEIQAARSRIPAPDELLVERLATRDGEHVILFPLDGRLVHEGLAALAAYRVSKLTPISVHATATDYGLDLHMPRGTRRTFDLDADVLRRVLCEDNLLEDLLSCLRATQLARRRFRDVARVAGLIAQGYPGQRTPTRHLQASSDMFFDVFEQFDPGNLLLKQACREVLEDQLEVRRLRRTLQRLAALRIVVVDTERLTPMAFPVWAEVLRGVHASSETWSQRVARMSEELEAMEPPAPPVTERADKPPRAAPSRPARRSRRAAV